MPVITHYNGARAKTETAAEDVHNHLTHSGNKRNQKEQTKGGYPHASTTISFSWTPSPIIAFFTEVIMGGGPHRK